jgi:hypothetical protein
VEGGHAKEVMLHYVVKREYSEQSAHIRFFKFPLSALGMDSSSSGDPSAKQESRCVLALARSIPLLWMRCKFLTCMILIVIKNLLRISTS